MSAKELSVLAMIAEDMANDAKEFDGKPFNGKTVSEYLGRHGAAIAALATTILRLEQEKVNSA